MNSCLFYFHFLQDDISNFDMVMESDDGTFMPLGFQFTGLSLFNINYRWCCEAQFPVQFSYASNFPIGFAFI